MSHYFGSHISISNGLINAAKTVKKAGGNFLQIYLDKSSFEKIYPIHSKELIKFKQFLIKNNMKLVIHTSYTHNIARDWDKSSPWIHSLLLEIKYAHILGAIGIVIHFGKQLELSLEEAYNNMYTSLVYINKMSQDYQDVKIFLETTAGQGTEMCYKIEDLAYFFKKIKNIKTLKKRIKICFDTCHVFSAGYCFKNKNNIKLFLDTFEELIGLKYIALVHLNDSKVDCGMRRDRHENIGKGYIGFSNLKLFFNFFKKRNIPIILETPNLGYLKEIPRLSK